MTRIDIINHFIEKYSFTDYLEIGVQNGGSFRAVKAQFKTGVDPDPMSRATHHTTSDSFFETNKKKFDIIFVDGLHESKQVYKDIINSLKVLKPNGVIICHDMIPVDELSQRIPRQVKVWMGDCWKAWIRLRYEEKGLEMRVVDTDCGCGIIRRGEQNLINKNVTDFHEFNEHKAHLLNIIDVKEFKEIY